MSSRRHASTNPTVLFRLQAVTPALGTIIASALVMNVFDVIAAFNARDIIGNELEKMIYGYIKDEMEALTWFGVHARDNTEVLKVDIFT